MDYTARTDLVCRVQYLEISTAKQGAPNLAETATVKPVEHRPELFANAVDHAAGDQDDCARDQVRDEELFDMPAVLIARNTDLRELKKLAETGSRMDWDVGAGDEWVKDG